MISQNSVPGDEAKYLEIMTWVYKPYTGFLQTIVSPDLLDTSLSSTLWEKQECGDGHCYTYLPIQCSHQPNNNVRSEFSSGKMCMPLIFGATWRAPCGKEKATRGCNGKDLFTVQKCTPDTPICQYIWNCQTLELPGKWLLLCKQSSIRAVWETHEEILFLYWLNTVKEWTYLILMFQMVQYVTSQTSCKLQGYILIVLNSCW